MGTVSDKFNRKNMLGIVVILGALSQYFSGSVNSFIALWIFRVLHSSFNSTTNPLYLSLISDYIPKDNRSTANAILNSASYIGIALSSMSILSI
jgi:sugar phosphate permease